MAGKYFCDGGCETELKGDTTDLMIRRPGDRSWRRHSLCDDCAAKNVFVHDKLGKYVSDGGFASDLLR